jgi:putative membrane protein
MLHLLVRLAVNAIALWVAIEIVPGIDHDGTGTSLLLIALVFGLVNALVRPFLLLMTCPLIVLTLGLFLVIVNAILLELTAWLSGPDVLNLGLTIDSFWSTLLGSIVISVLSGVINLVVKDVEAEDRRGSTKKPA